MDWIFPTDIDIPDDLLLWTGSRLLARLLVQRGFDSVEAAQAFMLSDHYEPSLASDLPDMAEAVACLKAAIDAQAPICVWGDFDVDGQTSTALLVSLLTALGAEVTYYIPDRLTEGHGIHIAKLDQILQAGAKLILTCDTGIEAHEAVDLVGSAGANIIITDHHDLGESLPAAEAVINPKRLPPEHPLRELPGVGVAYKVAEALSKACGRPELADQLLDLVSLGIVADVAVQTQDTRYLLQRGLAVLRQTKRPGLVTLINLANLNQDQLTAEHIGFWLGPRLNALGRLSDANQAVELLTTADTGRARILAAQLDALNERRKMLVDRTVVQALSQLADTPTLAEYNAIVLASSEWHPGIIGIAASRLVERFFKPVILLTEREGLLRGSARSVAGCDIHQAIKTQASLLTSFGGHPMAAGLAFTRHHLADFRQGLSTALADCVAEQAPQLTIDATITLPDLNLDLLHTLQKLAPFGPGNPPVTLAVTGLTIENETLIGRARNHRKLQVADQAGQTAEVIWWNSATEPLPHGLFDLALRVDQDNYARDEAIQLLWVAAREQSPGVVPIERQILDLRSAADPLATLNPEQAIFFTIDSLPQVSRFSYDISGISQKPDLVFWQAPPGQDVFQQVIALVQPDMIAIVARPAPFDTFSTFTAQLMGLIKYSLTHYSGRLVIAAIANAMGHRPATIRLAIEWLVSQGKLRLITATDTAIQSQRNFIQDDEIILVRADNGPPVYRSETLQQALLELLRETAAYRSFFRRANVTALGLSNVSESFV